MTPILKPHELVSPPAKDIKNHPRSGKAKLIKYLLLYQLNGGGGPEALGELQKGAVTKV